MTTPLEKECSVDTIVSTDATLSEEEQYMPDVNIQHILDKRLKEIEDANIVKKKREEYATSKYAKPEEEKPKGMFYPLIRLFH